MEGRTWRVRLASLAAAGGFLAVALGVRVLASGGGVLDSSGALQQYSGTALYASMVYAGVFLLAPGARPTMAGAAAVTFCWLVEMLQLTRLPAELSEHSLVARLVLGVRFDATDLAWYPVGVLPLVLLHLGFSHWRLRSHDRQPTGHDRVCTPQGMAQGQGPTNGRSPTRLRDKSQAMAQLDGLTGE